MPSMDSAQDYMLRALQLAQSGLGRTAPNPTVGCVIVKDNHIIAEARTADGGRPHAEALALAEAAESAQGATAYVTLEPCAHHGQTPPCAQRLIDAGVKAVVIACTDPNPLVQGKGARMLKEAGIEVTEGLCQAQAEAINAGFFKRFSAHRPWVTLKMALSQDQKIAGANGQPLQISGEASHKHMHRHLRATHDAILVGMGTALSDNPRLSTRYLEDGQTHTITRVLWGDLEGLPANFHLKQADAANPVLSYTQRDLPAILRDLAETQGLTRLLVEGGTGVMRSFLKAECWDELYLYHSPLIVGDEGVDAPDFSSAQPFLQETQEIGADRLEIYKRPA